MSARSEPKAASCRFCSDNYTAAGVKNHERYCGENPNAGVHPDDAPNMFDSDGPTAPSAPSDEKREAPAGGADPDQRANDAGAVLPDRETLSEDDKGDPTGDEPEECPNCASTNVVSAHAAREEVAVHLDGVPSKLRRIFDATEHYCNNCFAVYGGELEAPHVLGGER